MPVAKWHIGSAAYGYRASALTRDIYVAILSICLSVRPSVCLSVRDVAVLDENDSIKHLHEMLTGSPPAGALNTGGYKNFATFSFLPISRYISQTIQDSTTVTMEDE